MAESGDEYFSAEEEGNDDAADVDVSSDALGAEGGEQISHLVHIPVVGSIHCPYCLEPYHCPRTLLNCMHSFCERCICDYVRSEMERAKQDYQSYCPVCKVSFAGPCSIDDIQTWSNTLPANGVLVAVASGRGTYMNRLCEPCNVQGVKSLASKVCRTCKEFQCLDCEKVHSSSKATRLHDIQNIEKASEGPEAIFDLDNIEVCSDRCRRRVEYYCYEHDTMVCSNCAMNKHKQCKKVVEMVELNGRMLKSTHIEGMKSNLDTMDDCLRHTTDTVLEENNRHDAQINETRHTLNHVRKQFNAAFDAYEKKVVAHIQSEQQLQVEKRSGIARRFDQLNAALTVSRTLFDTVVQHGTPLQAFKYYHVLTKQMHNYSQSIKEEQNRGQKLDILVDESKYKELVSFIREDKLNVIKIRQSEMQWSELDICGRFNHLQDLIHETDDDMANVSEAIANQQTLQSVDNIGSKVKTRSKRNKKKQNQCNAKDEMAAKDPSTHPSIPLCTTCPEKKTGDASCAKLENTEIKVPTDQLERASVQFDQNVAARKTDIEVSLPRNVKIKKTEIKEPIDPLEKASVDFDHNVAAMKTGSDVRLPRIEKHYEFTIDTFDGMKPWFGGVVYLQNGQTVLSDLRNRRLIRLNHLFEFVSEIPLSESPRQMALINEHNIALTLVDRKKIYIYSLKTSFSLFRTLDTTSFPKSVRRIDDESFLVSMTTDDTKEDWCLAVMKLDGSVISTFSFIVCATHPKDGYQFVVDPSFGLGERMRIWSSCKQKRLLYCMDMKGTPLLFCKIDCPSGIDLDTFGNVYVCDHFRHEIHQLSKDGNRVSTVSSKNVRQPTDLCFNASGDTFVVTQYKSAVIHVFKLKRSTQ